MRLCDEYALRRGVDPSPFKKPDQAFVLWSPRELLSIKWADNGPHPGFYEFTEMALDTNFRLLKIHNVQWEDYESFVDGWLSSKDRLVESRTDVFRASWEFFLRSKDDFLASKFSPHEVAETLEGDEWMHKAVLFLDKVSAADSMAGDFWWSRVGNIYSKYAFWMCDIFRSRVSRTTLSS